MAATFHASGKAGQTATLASFGITCTISTGDSVVVFGSWAAASTTTPTVATTGGTGSDAFTLVYGPFTSGSFKYGGWLLQSAGAGRTGATMSWASSSPPFADGFCESFSGLASPVLDQVKFGSGTGTAATSGNTPTLTAADEFAIAYAASAGSVSTCNAPWTSDGIIAGTSSGGGHRVLAATTAISTSFTCTNAGWISFALTFKASSTSRTANLALTEANDTFSATGTHPVTATRSGTEAGDTPAAAGTLPVSATAAVIEGFDSLTANGTVPSQGINATLSVTEANDALVMAGFHPATAGLAATEGDDGLSAAASHPITASMAATEVADSLTASAAHPSGAGLTAAEAGDTLTANGTGSGINASLTVTEANDSLSGAAIHPVAANLSAAEADGLTASATHPVTATLAKVEVSDTLAAVAVSPQIAVVLAEPEFKQGYAGSVSMDDDDLRELQRMLRQARMGSRPVAVAKPAHEYDGLIELTSLLRQGDRNQ